MVAEVVAKGVGLRPNPTSPFEVMHRATISGGHSAAKPFSSFPYSVEQELYRYIVNSLFHRQPKA
jgi:hypothetical protein